MSQFNMEELMECFAYVEDPRVQRRSKHLLIDILVIGVCATICGAQACTEIEIFAEQKLDWLKQFLELPGGVPSHDTFARVLSLVDPLQMEAAFSKWVDSIKTSMGESTKHISLDGKSVAGTVRRFKEHPLHIVSAYSHELGLTLTQAESPFRGLGETQAALNCLQTLEIKGVTVLGDAALSTRTIVNQIRLQKGDYVLPIKGNQRLSRDEMETCFEIRKMEIKSASSHDNQHGRTEMRTCEVLNAKGLSEKFMNQWTDVKSIIRVTRQRTATNRGSTKKVKQADGSYVYSEDTDVEKSREDVTYYVSSRSLAAQKALEEVRTHWNIENGLHWQLDVAFSEDTWRTRAKSLARTLTILRKIALNIIKSSKTKGSVRARIKMAGWNNEFLSLLIFGRKF